MISLRDRLIGLLQNYLLLSTSIFSWTKNCAQPEYIVAFAILPTLLTWPALWTRSLLGYSGEKLLFGARALDSLFISYAHSVEYNWELPA